MAAATSKILSVAPLLPPWTIVQLHALRHWRIDGGMLYARSATRSGGCLTKPSKGGLTPPATHSGFRLLFLCLFRRNGYEVYPVVQERHSVLARV